MDLRSHPQRLLACIGDRSRYRLLMRLSQQRMCVSELATDVGLSQSCTTRHLQALTVVGLVRPAREGKRVVYALRDDDPEVDRLVHWMMGSPGAGGPPRSPAPAASRRSAAVARPAPRSRQARQPRAAATPPSTAAPPAALTEGTPAVDGAGAIDSTEIQRPPRAADLEDFLL
jgi:ArsR family transcriptional regulator